MIPREIQLGVLPTPFCRMNLVVPISNQAVGGAFVVANPFNWELIETLERASGTDSYTLLVASPSTIRDVFQHETAAPHGTTLEIEPGAVGVREGLPRPNSRELGMRPPAFLADHVLAAARADGASEVMFEPRSDGMAVGYRIDDIVHEEFVIAHDQGRRRSPASKHWRGSTSTTTVARSVAPSRPSSPAPGTSSGRYHRRALWRSDVSWPCARRRASQDACRARHATRAGRSDRLVPERAPGTHRGSLPAALRQDDHGVHRALDARAVGQERHVRRESHRVPRPLRQPAEHRRTQWRDLPRGDRVDRNAGTRRALRGRDSRRADRCRRRTLRREGTGDRNRHGPQRNLGDHGAGGSWFTAPAACGQPRVPYRRPPGAVAVPRLLADAPPGCRRAGDACAIRRRGGHRGRRPTGCPACRRTGVRGLTGVFEVVVLTNALREQIAAGATPAEIRSTLRSTGTPILGSIALDALTSGRLTVESALGAGLADDRDMLAESLPVPVAHDPDAVSVLLVDDAEDNRELLQLTLTNAGFSVSIARNGVEAIRLLERGTFDLMLSDLRMPLMDGFGLLNETTRGSKVPLVIFSASSDPADEVRALLGGAIDFVRVPVRKEILLARVRHALTIARGLGSTNANRQ